MFGFLNGNYFFHKIFYFFKADLVYIIGIACKNIINIVYYIPESYNFSLFTFHILVYSLFSEHMNKDIISICFSFP